MNRSTLLLFFAAGLLTTSSSLAADTTFFGGTVEKFKGAGDKQPPQCEIDVPNGASEEFFIRWNCKDQFNNTPPEKIRSAVWIKRTNDTRWIKIDDFLGFPSSLFVDKALLKLSPEEDFTGGLPVSFKFEAMDTAGITTISESFTVLSKTSSFSSCSLSVITQPTAATEGSSGTPSSTVTVTDAPVKLDSATDTTIALSTTAATAASVCEIDSICSDDDQVSFNINLAADTNNTATGTVLVSPGNLVSNVTGTVSKTSSAITGISVSGTATVDGATADVTVTCASTSAGNDTSQALSESTSGIDSAGDSTTGGSAEEDVVVQELEVADTTASDTMGDTSNQDSTSSVDDSYTGSARRK